MRGPLLFFILFAAGALPATAATQGKLNPKVTRDELGVGAARIVESPNLPPRADGDRDGLSNGVELHRTRTNPRKFDTDGDGFGDGAELIAGSNPLRAASVPAPRLRDSNAPSTPPGGHEPGPEKPPQDDITPPVTEPEAPSDCTVSLSPGANVADAVAAASGGAVICLEAGNYGGVSIDGVHKSPPVTVRSGPDGRATFDGISLTDPSGLRFVALDIANGTAITPSGTNVQFIDNDITGVAGIYLFGDYREGKSISDVLIEGNNIHDLDYSGSQEAGYGYGIEGIGDVRNVTIRDNTIKSPASDYIQSATPIDWVVDHNTFLGPSLLGDHEDHQDLWQVFGGGENIAFTNNVARNTETQESLLFQEGDFRNVDIENNLFDHDSLGYTCQIYQSTGLTFRNNTVVGSYWGCLFRDLASSPPGSGYEVDHNVFAETEAAADIAEEGRAAEWGTYDYNVSSDSSAEGLNSVRNWSPSWSDTTSYTPLGLPFAAGYRP